jgi:polyribonucleotide nucleotidyltransferase
LIIDPPEAEVGATYQGKVVNITKFGAFVNILPGRDGLLHISKLGGGKRVDRVESVLDLGQEVEVRVDDIDPQGKVSLSLASELPAHEGGDSSGSSDSNGSGSEERSGGSGRSSNTRDGVEVVSFEAGFEEELTRDLGDLGPEPQAGRDGGDRPDRGGQRRPARRGRR